MSLGNFELDIQRFVDKAKGNITLVVRRIALDIFRRVIMKSPVDTGRFKSNWQVAIGSIPMGTIELAPEISKDKDGKETERGGAHRSGAAGTASISRVDAAILGLKAGDLIYLVNNLEYARPLEYGHSNQAPSGMVRLSISEYPGVVSKAASEVSR